MRHLCYCIDLTQYVFPVGAQIFGLREKTRHPDNSHVRRTQVTAFTFARVFPGQARLEYPGCPLTEFTVKRLNGKPLTAQGRKLTDHIDTAGLLLIFFDRFEPSCASLRRALPHKPLARQTQPADDHILKASSDLIRGELTGAKPLFFFFKYAHKRSIAAAYLMARPCLKYPGLAALDSVLLKFLKDGPCLYGLLCKQVGRTHQHSHTYAAPCQRRGQKRDHSAGEAVVNTSGKEYIKFFSVKFAFTAVEPFYQPFKDCLPQDKARTRPDMAAALAALKDKTPYPRIDINIQKPRRRHMHIRAYPSGLKGLGLLRPSPCQYRVRRRVLIDRFKVRVQYLVTYKAQQPDPPGLFTKGL